MSEKHELDTSIVELKWLKASRHNPAVDGVYLVAFRVKKDNGYKEFVDLNLYEDGKWFGVTGATKVIAFTELPRFPRELTELGELK